MTPKDKPPTPRSEGVQCATGEERKTITKSFRKDEAVGPKWGKKIMPLNHPGRGVILGKASQIIPEWTDNWRPRVTAFPSN